MRLIIYLFVLVNIIRVQAQTLYFPPLTGTTWETINPSSLGWCNEKIDTLLNYLEDKNTKAFILLKDGKIVIENYFGTFTRDSLWYWASAGKTMTAFTVGIAQQENYLKLSDTTAHIIGSGWTSCSPTQEEKITIWHELTMTSGLDDGVPDHYCTTPSCLQYLADAGTRWAYHNGPYTMLDSVLEIATGQTLNTYVTQKIKTPTGIKGNFYPSGYNNVFVSDARSMARFGLLILNNGNWNGNQIMTDATYFHDMVNTSQSLNKSYGYLWWLNGKESFMVPTLQTVITGYLSPNAPADMIAALGKNGQFINVVPSQNIVLIRMGNNPTSGEVPFTFNDTIWQKLNDMSCGSTSIGNKTDYNINIYPNPANNIVTIEYPQNTFDIELKDVSGRIIFYEKTIQDRKSLDLNLLCNGIYIIEIKSGDTLVATHKLVKCE